MTSEDVCVCVSKKAHVQNVQLWFALLSSEGLSDFQWFSNRLREAQTDWKVTRKKKNDFKDQEHHAD